jgi:sporadic carbohydrate cluster 2OG-Fe(II) oxygenase/sporadic carbohydrate cluster protein (TIGR04323 family)
MPNTYRSEWDNQTASYSVEQFDWYNIWLSIAQEKYPQLKSFEELHEQLELTEITELVYYLQKASLERDYIVDKLDEYYSFILKDRTDLEWMLQRTMNFRIVIPDQTKAGRLLQFHKDEWTGNGPGIKNIWTPITDSYDSNSMYVLSQTDSDDISKYIHTEQMSADDIQQMCLSKATPLKLSKGEVFFFNSDVIHGNVNNTTGKTRVSMDGRIILKGGNFNRKLPGGYFRFLGEHNKIIDLQDDKVWVTYAGWNSRYTKDIPVHLQRHFVNTYCEEKNIHINDYQYESDTLDWQPNFESYIQSEGINGIVCFSVFGLPDDPFRRQKLLMDAVDTNTELVFANEDIICRTRDDIEHIKHLYSFYIQGQQ